jgi:hypothetical protein
MAFGVNPDESYTEFREIQCKIQSAVGKIVNSY